MKYSMKGTIKINLDDVFTTDAESKVEAIEQIIERMVENGVFGKYLDDSELTVKGIKKTFKVTVTEIFTNTVGKTKLERIFPNTGRSCLHNRRCRNCPHSKMRLQQS